ncbi:peptidoglycan-binding protein [Actinopolymorpha sp. B17G11]|uniref:peptidoglycan-binding domain-containing protein n=1 Tax=unclassified Actinopolymorpha TaxID=2627063 RepID=UPI0032D8E351
MSNVLVAVAVSVLVILGGCSDRQDRAPSALPAADRTASPSTTSPLATATPGPPSQVPRTGPPSARGTATPQSEPAPPRATPREADPKLGIGSLRRGSQGEAVKELQRDLNAVMGCGWLAVDGDFGPLTESAVRVFQQIFGLVVDGVYGPQSAAMMTLLRGDGPGCP